VAQYVLYGTIGVAYLKLNKEWYLVKVIPFVCGAFCMIENHIHKSKGVWGISSLYEFALYRGRIHIDLEELNNQ
jgi:hypothetical protein